MLFVEKGYDATRPQDIAQAADVAAGTFYVHFPLEALCDSSDANPGVLSTVFADDAVCAAELPRGTSLRDRLGKSLASTLRLAMDSGEIHADIDPELIAHGTVGFIHSALVHASGHGLDRRNVLDDLERFLIRALLARTPHVPDEEDS